MVAASVDVSSLAAKCQVADDVEAEKMGLYFLVAVLVAAVAEVPMFVTLVFAVRTFYSMD